MSQNDHRAQDRENPEPEEGNYAVPRLVKIWIAILLVWGVGYYAWQIGKPLQGGDSRTAPQVVDATQTIDGATLFQVNCSACHQATGLGIPGAFPPLANSEWLLADPAIPVAIVHDGLQGSISVHGNTFQGMMPAFGGTLSNEEIAAILTFERSSWGNKASAVTPADVEKHAAKYGKRGNWSASELEKEFNKLLQGGDSKTPTQASDSKTSAQVSDNKTPTQASDDKAPAQASDDKAPAQESDNKAPVQASDNKTPVQASDNKTLAQVSDSKAPAQVIAATQTIDGATLFQVNCSACHQATGLGIPGAFPPLANSEWLLADSVIPVAIVHDGLQGSVSVDGNTFQGMMPAFGGMLSNEEIAAVLTFERSSWGNKASPVAPADVEKHVAKYGKRGNWSAAELEKEFGKP